MKIVSIGGGPAGLYFAILMKRAFPDSQISVHERNRPEDTFGWGVVFSDETLANFAAADFASCAEISASFRHWQQIETHYRGTCTVSTGHGFAALSRKKLLTILRERCMALGVDLVFQHEISSLDEFADADLILGADGINSKVRELHAEHFKPRLDWRQCKFCWLGTDRPLDAFTFIFKETPHGLFQVHAYPFEDNRGTWIVECQEDVWRASGLHEASEEETVAFCEDLFSEQLEGYHLLSNRSVWRSFPTVRCETWHHGNVVLLGDAAHTAHFSIGSGTKLAMEDAMFLADCFKEQGVEDVPAVLAKYQDERWVDTLKLQKAAQTSLEWFENSARYMGQDPLQLTFNLMTRSKRITHGKLRVRDPELVDRVDEGYRERAGAAKTSGGKAPPPVFTSFKLREMELANRVVVSPMCQYSAVEGTPNDWHLVHLGSRAIGGAGLVITEMTNVEAAGRISPGCAGMYDEGHRDAWKRIVEFAHSHSRAKMGIQLAHAGRKGSVRHAWTFEDTPLMRAEGAWKTMAPSPEPFEPDWPAPREMNRGDMDRIRDAFVQAARWSDEAGFDLVELHMAHGYLLSSFISPLSNHRTDEYGGGFEDRVRYPLEVFRAVRKTWPADKPISVRISATDWMEDGSGTTPEESVELAKLLGQAGCDIIDVSTAGNSPVSKLAYGRMYQVPFAEKIRFEAEIPVMAVGAIQGVDHANTILAAGRADLTAMARPHLGNPYLTLHAAESCGFTDQAWPGQYLAGKSSPS